MRRSKIVKAACPCAAQANPINVDQTVQGVTVVAGGILVASGVLWLVKKLTA